MSNLGTQAAAEIDSQIAAFRTLQEELGQHNANFGTLMAQRNENEMVLKELEICQAEEGEGGESVVYKQVSSNGDSVFIKGVMECAMQPIFVAIKKHRSNVSSPIAN